MAQDTAGIAFFDFDGTLIAGDSLLYFLEEIAGPWPARLAFAEAALRAGSGMAAPSVNHAANHVFPDFRTRVKAAVLERLLAGVSPADCRAAGERVAQRLRWNARMLEILGGLRGEGWRIVLATGALDAYLPALLAPISPLDGIIATGMAVHDGRLTGAMATANCVRREKARRVADYLTAAGSPPAIAYGNRPSDLPMMAAVGRGVIVRLHRGQPQPELTPYAPA